MRWSGSRHRVHGCARSWSIASLVAWRKRKSRNCWVSRRVRCSETGYARAPGCIRPCTAPRTRVGMAEPGWEAIEALFDAAMDQPAAERRAWLERNSADPALKSVVSRMLAADARSNGPLDQQVDLTPFSLVTQLE